ncbi:glutathione-disulfide reductase [Aureococcus anophagefferens]|nr:glutathione-disulfide reductase [Aureococcus anophagefferens]
MKRAGMKIATGTTLAKVEVVDGKKVVTTTDGATLGPFDEVLMAVGRKPLVEPLKLENAGVDLNEKGYVSVDEYQRTTSEHNVYALGDVCGAIELTPMAIAAGRRLSDRLFGGPECANAKADYEACRPSSSHPTIGTIGLTEAEALKIRHAAPWGQGAGDKMGDRSAAPTPVLH